MYSRKLNQDEDTQKKHTMKLFRQIYNILESDTDTSEKLLNTDEINVGIPKHPNTDNITFLKQQSSIGHMLKKRICLHHIDEIETGEALSKVFYIAIPGIFFWLCFQLMFTMNLGFVGKVYNNVYMIDGMGLGTLFLNCTFISIAVGLIGGIEILGANAFGIKNHRLFGLYIHRGRLVTYIFAVIMIVFNIAFGEQIMKFLSMDDLTAYYAYKYLKVANFLMLFEIQFNANWRYLNIVDKSYVNTIIMTATVALHPIWCYIFTCVFDMDVEGIAFAMIITQFLNALISSIYVHFYNPYPETYFWFNKDCFKGWWDYISFTAPSIILLCGEWWGWELQSIVALYIKDGQYDYSAHILLSNMNSIFYSITCGFAIAASILVGEYIAEGKVNVMKKISLTTFIFGQSVMIILSLLYYFLSDYLIHVFTSEDKIISKTLGVIGIQALGLNFDMTQSILANICRGLGKQLIASTVTLVCYYGYALTLSCVLVFYFELGVTGLWISIASGYFMSSVLYACLLLCFDYEKIKEETNQRLENDILQLEKSASMIAENDEETEVEFKKIKSQVN